MRRALLLALAARAFACQAVEGDHILGKDLALASGLFAGLDPALEIAPTPLPGVPRLFHADELTRLAARNGLAIAASMPELCFERATEPLTADRLLPVLRSALGMAGARIEIEDFSRAGVPAGEMMFARSGLTAGGLWRGQVVYGEARSVPVWARVRVTVEGRWVEAVETLPAGKAITRAQLAERTGPRSAFGPAALDSIDLAAGREPLRTVKAGDPLFGWMLVGPREVARGDKVKVMVLVGEAKIEFEAEAETSGRRGDLVTIRNPDNGRPFQARVDGKDKVLIQK